MRDIAQDRLEERCLAAPVGADDSGEFAAVNVEVDILEDIAPVNPDPKIGKGCAAISARSSEFFRHGIHTPLLTRGIIGV